MRFWRPGDAPAASGGLTSRMRFLVAALIVLAVAAGAAAILVWRPALPEIAEAPRPDGALVARGAELAAIGNCVVCHTAPGGKPLAGGLGLHTPFGIVRSTNITPDRATGIGTWSEAAFIRAMNEGVDRAGRHLYPVFPYDHFSRVSDADNRAIYAFLMSRTPVAAANAPNDLAFPVNWRPLLAGWKLLFLDDRRHARDPAASAEIDRGAYLAEGLGHCGACHSPRNLLGATTEPRWSGGEADGWVGYAIDRSSPAPVPWTRDSLFAYLRHGFEQNHGIARGSMAPVTANLGTAPEADVRAIAAYVAMRMGAPASLEPGRAQAIVARRREAAGDPSHAMGRAIYEGACASCHDGTRAVPHGGLDLALSSAMQANDPQNIINVVTFGLPAPEGESGAIMPGFAGTLDDRQMAALLAYLRSRFSDRPAWSGLEAKARDTRTGAHPVAIYRSDGVSGAPAAVGLGEMR